MKENINWLGGISVEFLYYVLDSIKYSGSGGNITDISRDKAISYSYVHDIIKRLAKVGIVKAHKEGVSVNIELTESGLRLLNALNCVFGTAKR